VGPPIALALASNLVNNSYKYANGIGAVVVSAPGDSFATT
jgi:hypothetical protein